MPPTSEPAIYSETANKLTEQYQSVLPATLEPFQRSHVNLGEIVSHFQDSYSPTNKLLSDKSRYTEVLKQLQQFAIQGLSALAYQMHLSATSLEKCLHVQTSELERMLVDSEIITQVTRERERES